MENFGRQKDGFAFQFFKDQKFPNCEAKIKKAEFVGLDFENLIDDSSSVYTLNHNEKNLSDVTTCFNSKNKIAAFREKVSDIDLLP